MLGTFWRVGRRRDSVRRSHEHSRTTTATSQRERSELALFHLGEEVAPLEIVVGGFRDERVVVALRGLGLLVGGLGGVLADQLGQLGVVALRGHPELQRWWAARVME